MNIYDIAAEANTSISTVSRVLNNKGNVNPQIRKRVEEALKKYDYKPSAIARGMVSKTMKSIAILTIDVRVTHYARMIYVIEQEFSNQGYNVTVCNTGGSIGECDRYFKILAEKQIDGLVLIGSIFNNLIHYPQIIAQIKEIPVVLAMWTVRIFIPYWWTTPRRSARWWIICWTAAGKTWSMYSTWRMTAPRQSAGDLWRD